jgi:hypothetical protein
MPVEPVVNFQIAMSSGVVGAGSSASGASATSASKLASPSRSSSGGHADRPAARAATAGRQLGARLAHAVERARVGHHHAGPRVVEVVGEVLDRQEGVDLGGDRADLLRGVPGGHELDPVGEREQHALLLADAEIAQDVAGAVDERGELGVAHALLAAQQRGAVAAPSSRWRSTNQLVRLKRSIYASAPDELDEHVGQGLERRAALLGGRLRGRAAVRALHAHREEVGAPGGHRRGHVDLVRGQVRHAGSTSCGASASTSDVS